HCEHMAVGESDAGLFGVAAGQDVAGSDPAAVVDHTAVRVGDLRSAQRGLFLGEHDFLGGITDRRSPERVPGTVVDGSHTGVLTIVQIVAGQAVTVEIGTVTIGNRDPIPIVPIDRAPEQIAVGGAERDDNGAFFNGIGWQVGSPINPVFLVKAVGV